MGVSKVLLTPSVIDAVVEKVGQKRITNSKDLRKLRLILKDPVAKQHFLSQEGSIDSSLLRLPVAQSEKSNEFVGQLDAAMGAIRQLPWTDIERLKGNSSVIRQVEEAEALLTTLRKNLTSND